MNKNANMIMPVFIVRESGTKKNLTVATHCFEVI